MLIDFLFTNSRIEKKLDELLILVKGLSVNMTEDFAKLAAQAALNANIEQSAIGVINGLVAKLAAATTMAEVQAVTDQLKSSADALAAGIANVPVT